MLSRIIAALLFVAVPLAPAFAQAPIVIKFSHVVAQGTPKGKGAEKFKELAEAKSQIAKLASINETLLLENQALRAEASASNVRRLGTKNRASVFGG